MTEQKINQHAIKSLDNQNWEEAQRLFYLNAKTNPSYKTFNNLGHYLVSEGLLCKGGIYRNASKLGIKYLYKALSMQETSVTLSAISQAFKCELVTATQKQKQEIYNRSIVLLSRALSLEYTKENHYNLLRLMYLTDAVDEDVYCQAKTLVQEFTNQESVSLCLELQRIMGKTDDGIRLIQEYRTYLNNMDLLMFYAKFEMWNNAFDLCDDICQCFALDKYLASAIIECCVYFDNRKKAKEYAQSFLEHEKETGYLGNKLWAKEVFKDFDIPSLYRKKLINGYRYIPPMIEMCCYYGCNIHKIYW